MSITVKIKKELGDFSLETAFEGTALRIGILGASGCGKSMTLKCIAGIETPDEGEISINGKTVFSSVKGINEKPQKRNTGYLFQNYALFPTMSVEENIAAGVRGNKAEKRARVAEMIERFQLSGLEKRLPQELSGGQQQRVALARIMAYEPEIILLDEPFSALDMFLKDRLQKELKELLKDYKGTVILVSHNRDEIYQFCEELLIMDKGKAVCYGKTKELFEHPGKKEAARLTGCKNFSAVERVDKHTLRALDWGITLTVKEEIKETIQQVGFRAHEFIPVWGEKETNCLPVVLKNTLDFPFEKHFYIASRTEVAENICWFVQKENLRQIEEKGMPDYLRLPEEKIMLLE